MSATIYAKQIKPNEGTSLRCSWPSAFVSTMTRAFYYFPIELDADAIPQLSAMAATIEEGKDNPYQEIVELIEKWGTVKVYAVY